MTHSPTLEAPHVTARSDELGDDMESIVRELSRVFKLLADKTRLRILLLLTRHNELHVRALCDLLGQSQPAVSHHLGLLRMAGLIEPRREGKHNFYRVMPMQVQQLLRHVFNHVPNGAEDQETDELIRIASDHIADESTE